MNISPKLKSLLATLRDCVRVSEPGGACASVAQEIVSVVPQFENAQTTAGFFVTKAGNIIDDHWWIVMPDGSIFDPTQDQFGDEGFGDIVRISPSERKYKHYFEYTSSAGIPIEVVDLANKITAKKRVSKNKSLSEMISEVSGASPSSDVARQSGGLEDSSLIYDEPDDEYTPEEFESLLRQMQLDHNGSPSEGGHIEEAIDQRSLVNVYTPKFKSWFKNSKAVDDDGSPIVFFRGARRVPKSDKFGTIGGRATPSFVASADIASVYAATRGSFGVDYKPGAAVYPVFLSIQNPVDLRDVFEINLEYDLFSILNSDWDNEQEFEYALGIIEELWNFESNGIPFKYELPIGHLGNMDWEDLISNLRKYYAKGDLESVTSLLGMTYVDIFAIIDTKSFTNWAREKGFDGVVHVDVFDVGAQYASELLGKESASGLDEENQHTTWRPFYSAQVKSIFNVGKWSSKQGSPMTEHIYDDGDSGKFNYPNPLPLANEEIFSFVFDTFDDIIYEPKFKNGNGFTVNDIAIRDIIGTEQFLDKKFLSSGNVKQKPPTLAKLGSKYYVIDGNHRVVKALLDGKSHIKSKVLDLEKWSTSINEDIWSDLAQQSAETMPMDELMASLSDADRRFMVQLGKEPSEQAYLNNLQNSVSTSGIKNPIQLIILPDGKIRVPDGNHRIIVANRLGMTDIPYVIDKDLRDTDSIKEVDHPDYMPGGESGRDGHDPTYDQRFSQYNTGSPTP